MATVCARWVLLLMGPGWALAGCSAGPGGTASAAPHLVGAVDRAGMGWADVVLATDTLGAEVRAPIGADCRFDLALEPGHTYGLVLEGEGPEARSVPIVIATPSGARQNAVVAATSSAGDDVPPGGVDQASSASTEVDVGVVIGEGALAVATATVTIPTVACAGGPAKPGAPKPPKRPPPQANGNPPARPPKGDGQTPAPDAG